MSNRIVSAMVPIFHKTLHQKFWSSFKNGNVTKEEVLLDGYKKGIFTLQEFDEIAHADNYCLACEYDNIMYKRNGDGPRCENCPLEVPEFIKDLIPNNLSKLGCLDGLWEWYLLSLEKYKTMKCFVAMDTRFQDENFLPEILEQNPFHTVKVIDNIYDPFKDIAFSDWKDKAYEDIKRVAKLIANLPTKIGVPWQ